MDSGCTLRHDILGGHPDMLYSANHKVSDFHTRAYACKTCDVILQKIELISEVAEIALELAMSNGAASPALCASGKSKLIGKLWRFRTIRTTYFTQLLQQYFW